MATKDLYWCATSLEDLRRFSLSARKTAGFELHLVQHGEDPSDFKHMRSVGRGVFEIKVSEEGQAFRILYIAKYAEAVYVLHAFEKKSQRTKKKDIEIAKRRLRDVESVRRSIKQKRR